MNTKTNEQDEVIEWLKNDEYARVFVSEIRKHIAGLVRDNTELRAVLKAAPNWLTASALRISAWEKRREKVLR